MAVSQIAAINPMLPASMQVSTGYTTAADGTQLPEYVTVSGSAQVQALSFKDLKQIDGLNLSGTRRAIYFHGDFNGVVRPAQKGGDLINLTDPINNGTWLIAMVLEQWANWCKVVATLQNGS